jgi:N-acetyltransferase
VTVGAASVERWPGLEATLEGDLVVLESLTADHERELFEAARDPEIWTWLDFYLGESEESFHTFMEEALAAAEAGREQPLATRDARSGQLVGSTRFIALRPDDRALEIGWTWLNPSAWRTGINVEAKLLMLRHAFERLGCVRVEFKTDARNERSRAALAALPAQFEGIFRKHRIVPGVGQRDSAYYSVIDDEWPAVAANLERRLSA